MNMNSLVKINQPVDLNATINWASNPFLKGATPEQAISMGNILIQKANEAKLINEKIEANLPFTQKEEMKFKEYEISLNGFNIQILINYKNNFALQSVLTNLKVVKKKDNYIVSFKTKDKYLPYIEGNCETIEIASHDVEEADFDELDWHIRFNFDFKENGLSCSPVITPLRHEYHVAFIPLNDIINE